MKKQTYLIDMLYVSVLQIPCPVAPVLLPVLTDPLLAHLVEPVPASVTSSKSAHWLRPRKPPPPPHLGSYTRAQLPSAKIDDISL